MPRFDLVLGSVLMVLSAALSAGLRFGLSAEERAGEGLLVFYIYGFAWWAFLFSLPVVTWCRQKLTHQPHEPLHTE